ncbi:HAD family phosphatase [Geodermatophilus sp. DSM 44513]|uniref:HAD family hydrolase n=1 Tax=Geodermatophilus sp. DSM 44513 TaxID=1528104 RepID=UPI0028F7044F|nr:HAD family phosphatase [Geodermatophilus sp. DSM 44513]WNV77774.1 HAD family phosphatase [Geodermatophilus sp. DSM 44513]
MSLDVRPRCLLQAVLFDMDGTLVETEQHWGAALFALARRLGGEMSAAAREQTVGTSMRTSMGVLYADLGLTRTEAELVADSRWVEDAVAEMLAGPLDWRPGARELLTEARDAALPTALVTTTPRRLTDLVLAEVERDLGALPFDVTVCGDEVPARKPDPAPYRQAVTALGVDAAGCVALEDSLVGATAGLAAGLAVLGVPSLQPLPELPGLVRRDTLAGVRLADLASLLTARAEADARA